MSQIKGERSITINAPRELVYQYISDFRRHTEWNYQVQEIDLEPGKQIEAGTRFRAKERPPKHLPLMMKLMFPLMARMVGMDGTTETEVTELEPNHKIAWNAAAPLKGGDLWMRAEWEIELHDQNGSTLVTQRFQYFPEHEKAKSGMDPEKATAMTREGVDENLATLKHTLEAQAASDLSTGSSVGS